MEIFWIIVSLQTRTASGAGISREDQIGAIAAELRGAWRLAVTCPAEPVVVRHLKSEMAASTEVHHRTTCWAPPTCTCDTDAHLCP